MGVSDRELAPVGPFPVGIDNLNEQGGLQRSDDGKRVIALRAAVNCDTPRSGWPRRRGGYGQIVAGTRVHSLWHGGALPFMLFAAGADQYAMRKGQAPFVVRSTLAPREVSYAIPNDRVYASNGAQARCGYADGTAGAWGGGAAAGQPGGAR